LIGQWVMIGDSRSSSIHGYGGKWIGPTWSNVDENLIFSITPTKTEDSTRARVRIDLKLCPLVLAEITTIAVDKRAGPLIIDKRTELPFRQNDFLLLWRKVRAKAGLSPKLWNRDLRAGALTEASMSGASAEDRAKMAAHSKKMTQSVYDRDVLVSANRVAEARAKFRSMHIDAINENPKEIK
jgi:hypothetical protein